MSEEKKQEPRKFVQIGGHYLIEEFDTKQCHVEIYWVGFAYNCEDIYCIVSRHKIDNKEITRFGNKTQVLGMRRSYCYTNLVSYGSWEKM